MTDIAEGGLREALVKIKAALDERSEAGEAHLFLSIPYWDLEELLAAHPAPSGAGDVAAKVIREHEPRPWGCLWCPTRRQHRRTLAPRKPGHRGGPPMTIVEFLKARLAYDQQVCAATPGGAFKVVPLEGSTEAEAEAVHQFYHRFQPRWVERDLEAKRQLVRELAVVTQWNWPSQPDGSVPPEYVEGLRRTLRLLALPYADHPDYDQDWVP